MNDGRYLIRITLADGQVLEFHFLLATALYARVRQVREVLGGALDPITDEEIGLALWEATAQALSELEIVVIAPEARPLARMRYATYLAAIVLLRRRLIELGSSPIEEERKMGDSSARTRFDLRVLREMLDRLTIELRRWESALLGGRKIVGAVKGGTLNPYPLTTRVF